MTEDIAVSNFRAYLRINTMHPKPDYASARDFLINLGKELKLDTSYVETVPGKPMVILTWPGKNPDLKSVMLYSHTDVVPVYPEHWTHDPFAADKDDKGDIYARGAQDMKCVGIQHIEAVRRLKAKGVERLSRTIHLVFGADEEISGKEGMKKFVAMKEFHDLNIGFALDEGLASEDDTYVVSYAERVIWWLVVHCNGNPGHGSKFIENTAAEKFRRVVNRFLDYREEQRLKLEADSSLLLGDVTTINLTKIEGGVQQNVVPARLSAYFDIRIPPTVDFDKFVAEIESWIYSAGPEITHEFLQFITVKTMTPIVKSDPWWNAFSGCFEEMKLKFKPVIFIGATDARYLRELGYPAIGFSPMINTPVLLHDHDEFLNEKVFLDGLDIFVKLVERLGNVPPFGHTC